MTFSTLPSTPRGAPAPPWYGDVFYFPVCMFGVWGVCFWGPYSELLTSVSARSHESSKAHLGPIFGSVGQMLLSNLGSGGGPFAAITTRFGPSLPHRCT